MTRSDDRAGSLAEYSNTCPATYKAHDWRHATDAPGWKLGDECVRCQVCAMKAIQPSLQSHDIGEQHQK